jgi:ribosome-associated protein
MSDDLEIRDGLVIPEAEIAWATSPSSGPGGQNVNKVETRVTLLFDLEASPSLTEEHKARIRGRLAGRINKAGVLRVTSQKHRTQAANRQAARERFAELLAEALAPRRPRKRTRVPKAAKKRRLRAKRRRGEIKRQRGSVSPQRE